MLKLASITIAQANEEGTKKKKFMEYFSSTFLLYEFSEQCMPETNATSVVFIVILSLARSVSRTYTKQNLLFQPQKSNCTVIISAK